MNCTDQMIPEYKFFANNQTTINLLLFDIIISVDKLLPKSQKLIFNQFQGFLYKLSVCRLAKITSMRLNYV